MTTTWLSRLKAVLGQNRGYESWMRRSLQTIVLYEAKRCVADRMTSLRPFQRKAAYMDQINALMDHMDFLYPHQRAEILWRTASSKEPIDADIAWKRQKNIEKELGTLQKKMAPFVSKAKSHEEAVNLLVQHLYEGVTGFNGKPFPPNWEHAHNHCVMAYRLYYAFDALDPTFPAPISPREVIVPTERSIDKKRSTTAMAVPPNAQNTTEPTIDVAELLGTEKSALDERRKVLAEVREHLDILKEFEGIITEEDLQKRKRELYLALPPAPPPSAKKSREDESVVL